MPDDLSPSQRSLRARLAAHTLHAGTDSREVTKAARRASPGSDNYWMRIVDPDSELAEAERRRRATHAKQAYFTKLAYQSSRARRTRGGTSAS